ncbi:MAG TPA: helix-turn-helix transcriptional regulator [Pirellulales bacterium]|nr:helix-turn-helix transcriptional regulator [Pirellulales bacterium]
MKTVKDRSEKVDLGEAALTMAIAVLVERIRSLPPDDKEDLFELSKILFNAESDEEEAAAVRAVREILDQPKGNVVAFTADDEPIGTESWLDFVSARLREAREQAGLTQAELAQRTKLPQSHISRLENGVHSPSSATIEKIAAATGKPPSFFDPSHSVDDE